MNGAVSCRAAVRCVLTVAVLLASGCVGTTWQSTVDRDHPLVGRVWDVRRASFVGAVTVVEHLTDTRFVLLGEKHDNPDHHRLQASIVKQLIAAGRRPTVAFEMFTQDQTAAIERHLAAHPRDARGLGDAVEWKKSGWPEWSLYAPIAQAALDADLPIVAANLSASTLASVRRDGANGLDATFASRYRLDRPPPSDVERAMAQEIRDAHCGQAPEAALLRMILIQRARDAGMADQLVSGATADGAVLIAGAGHVRADRGVPAYLRRASPTATVGTVAFVEVERGATTPESYTRATGGDTPPFNYIWFTPRVDDKDPCETFRRSLERMRSPR